MSRDAVFLELIAGIAGLILLAGLGVVLLVRFILRQISGKGSWAALESRFATKAALPAGASSGQTIKIGPVIYRNSVTVAALAEGLYLALPRMWPLSRKQPLLIPWRALSVGEPTRLYWQTAGMLRIGAPTPTEIVIPSRLFPLLPSWLGSLA